MKLSYLALVAAFGLAACGGSATGRSGDGGGDSGGGDTGGDVGTDVPVPVETDSCASDYVCSGDILTIRLDGGTLYLRGLPFDDDPTEAVFTAAYTTDNGYTVYENNEPGTFNRYLALHRDTAGGEMTLGVVSIEGYQDFGYRGAWYRLNDLTTAIPTNGLVEYQGDYTGFMVFDGSGEQYITTGEVFMEVDFTDSILKGVITNRLIEDTDGNEILVPDIGSLPNLVLNDAPIDDGSFSGTVNSYDGPDTFENGVYQGYFGGSNAEVVGGILEATAPGFSEGDEDTGNITSLDTGIFTAECAGTTTGCAPVSP